MSGGIAYVYDPDQVFASKVNYEMVELQALDDVDCAFLDDTIRRHRDLTGSGVAERIIGDWAQAITMFRKVMPKDYQRVLTVIAESEAAGLDEAATIDKIMEAARV